MHGRETDELSLHSLGKSAVGTYKGGLSMAWGISRRSSELDYYLFRRALRSRVSFNVFVCDVLHHMENPRLQPDFCQFQTSHQQQLKLIPRVHWECLQDNLIRGVSLGRRDFGLQLLATSPACASCVAVCPHVLHSPFRLTQRKWTFIIMPVTFHC